jgi:hypothetical protein
MFHLFRYYEYQIARFNTLNKISDNTRIHEMLETFHSWNEIFDPYKKYYYLLIVGYYNK